MQVVIMEVHGIIQQTSNVPGTKETAGKHRTWNKRKKRDKQGKKR